MGLTELDDMVGALAANRSDVRSRGLTAVPCPDRNRRSGNVLFVPRKCLRDLMCDRLGGWMRCHVDPDKISAGELTMMKT